MTTQRKCQRCQENEFLMTTLSGAVIAWRNGAGDRGTWFCPNCDWGDHSHNTEDRDA